MKEAVCNPKMRWRLEAIGALLLANFLWGLSFPLIKAISLTHSRLDPTAGGWFIAVMTVASRFTLGTLAIAFWFALQWLRGGVKVMPTRREWVQGVGIGLFAAGGMVFQNDGLQYTRASTSAFLTQFYAVLIPLWIALRTRRSPTGIVWISLTLVLVGGAVLAGFDPRDMHLGRGEAETLLSSLFFMGQVLLVSREDYRGNRAIAITAVMFLTESAAFLLMIAILSPGQAALVAPFRSTAWLGFMGIMTVFCTLGAFLLMNAFQPRITPTEAGLIYCIEPIFSAAMALFLPAWFSAWANIQYANELLTPSLLVGGALITMANVYLQIRANP